VTNAVALSSDRIKTMVAQEIKTFCADDKTREATLSDFRDALHEPRRITVNFSGGLTQECWTVTRCNGPYRVIYMPKAGYFSLCVESEFGPLDIGVHGPAIDCFGSV